MKRRTFLAGIIVTISASSLGIEPSAPEPRQYTIPTDLSGLTDEELADEIVRLGVRFLEGPVPKEEHANVDMFFSSLRDVRPELLTLAWMALVEFPGKLSENLMIIKGHPAECVMNAVTLDEPELMFRQAKAFDREHRIIERIREEEPHQHRYVRVEDCTFYHHPDGHAHWAYAHWDAGTVMSDEYWAEVQKKHWDVAVRNGYYCEREDHWQRIMWRPA